MAVVDDFLLDALEPRITQDRRAELWLGALVWSVVASLLAMVVFIVVQAWPSFAHTTAYIGLGREARSISRSSRSRSRAAPGSRSTPSMPGR